MEKKEQIDFMPVAFFPGEEEAGTVFLGIPVEESELPDDEKIDGYRQIDWFKPSQPMSEEEWRDISTQLLNDNVAHTVSTLLFNGDPDTFQLQPLFKKEAIVTFSVSCGAIGTLATSVKRH